MKKGFTMVELLVTIIILGLLTTLVITSITSILDKSHREYYESQENMLVLAGRDYFADYRSKLPKEVGETSSVTVETLINEKYIDPVKDRNDNDCNFKKSSVTVQKITDKDYQYYVTLICDADKYETTEDRADPVIKYTPNKKSSTKPITVKMSVTDDKGVASFRYVITKDDEVIKDSGYQTYTGEIEETFTELGIYRIEGYAIDVSGNSSVKESGIYSVYKGINCAEVDYSSSTKVETWVNKDITVNVKVPKNTYRYEISTKKDSESYTLLGSYVGNGNQRVRFDSNGQYQIKVTLYDNDGNTCSISSDGYYLDKTAPTCNTTGAPSSWTNKDVTLKGTCSDTGGSGCDGNASKKIDSNTNGKVSPGKVYDKAGNSVTCPSVTVKVDKTKPTCKSSGGNSNWTNGSRTIKGTCSDTGGSGCTGNVSKTIDSNTNGSVSPGKVYDNAGNSATCSGVTVKIDKTAPKCTSSGGNSNWTNGSRTIKGTCSDTGGSGCTGNVSKNYNTPGEYYNQSPGTVYDKVGNKTVCPANQTVKIAGPPTKPTIDLHGYSSGSWTNQDVTITASSTSPLGINRYEYQLGDNYWNNDINNNPTGWNRQFNSNKTSMTIKINWESSYNYSIRAVDNKEVAGPGSDFFTVNIDKTAPTCNPSNSYDEYIEIRKQLSLKPIEEQIEFYRKTQFEKFPNTFWTQNNRTVTGTCNDSGGSGCRSNASTTFTTTTSLASPGYVYDNAGNRRQCGYSFVNVDKDNPYAPYLKNIKPLQNVRHIDYNCQHNSQNSTTNNVCTAYIYVTGGDATRAKFGVYTDKVDVGSGVEKTLKYFTSNGINADYCNWTEECGSYVGINAHSATAKYKLVDYSGRTGPELTINYYFIY